MFDLGMRRKVCLLVLEQGVRTRESRKEGELC